MLLSMPATQKLTTVAHVEHRLGRSCAKLAHHGKNCVTAEKGQNCAKTALSKIAIFWGGGLITSRTDNTISLTYITSNYGV